VKYLTLFFSRNATPNGTIFSMGHPWGKGIEVRTNKVPGVKNDPTLGDNNLYKKIHVV